MPAIWTSSERPISVRTVWVDGIRHAILSPDDPLINSKSRRRSRVSRNKSYSTEYQQLESRLDRLNSCFTNLQMVVDNNLSETKTPSHVYRKLSAPICPRISTGTYDSTTLESLLNGTNKTQKQLCYHKAMKEDSDFFTDKRDFKNNIYERTTPASEPDFKLNITECRQVERISDTFWNPLFERVLQWLDLSGRAQSYDFEDDFERRSSREEQQKWGSNKSRFPRLKYDSFEERERTTVKNYKLNKERNSECCKKEGNKILRRLPKIKSAREQFQELDETSVDSLPYTQNKRKIYSKSDEEESKNEIKKKIIPTMWSPPGRRKLHIVIPNIVCKENCTSSQESLIND